jgi:hypothetical protein
MFALIIGMGHIFYTDNFSQKKSMLLNFNVINVKVQLSLLNQIF